MNTCEQDSWTEIQIHVQESANEERVGKGKANVLRAKKVWPALVEAIHLFLLP